MRDKVKNSSPYIIIGIFSILLLIRCFYSFTWSDESFYLTIVHRLWLGERMIADEWYTTQLSTPILMPFYVLYQYITGGNEGIYLYYRILYWGLSTFTTCYTFSKLKKYNSQMAALVCALIYLGYSRANIGGMSYYNLTLTMVLVSSILIYEQLMKKEFSIKKCYLIGLLLAIAVVNTPFLAFPYIVIMLGLFIVRHGRIYAKQIWAVILGTGTAAIIYLSYLFSMVTLEELLLNIPYILNEPELQSTNPILVIPIILARIAWRYKWTILLWGTMVAYVLYTRREHGVLSDKQIEIILGLNFVIFLLNSCFSWGLIGCINIAGVLMGIGYLCIKKDWKGINKIVLGVFGIAGLSTALAFSFSSDTGLDAMTIGFVLIAIAVVLLLFDEEKVTKSIMCAVWIMVLQTAVLRLFSVYRDAPLTNLDTMISSGPGKYLYTTEEHVEQYEEVQSTIEEYVRTEDRVFYSKVCFWSYLCTDNEYGVPSSWRMAFNSTRLEEYFELNPEKIPTCIFVFNPVYGNFESNLIQGNEKVEAPNDNIVEGYLADYIEENDYEVIETECATIYRKKEISDV